MSWLSKLETREVRIALLNLVMAVVGGAGIIFIGALNWRFEGEGNCYSLIWVLVWGGLWLYIQKTIGNLQIIMPRNPHEEKFLAMEEEDGQQSKRDDTSTSE